MSAGNPFFSPWTNAFGFPPFDLIKPEHFPPALDRGMEEGLADFEAIAGSAEAPTFANTIEAMESGRPVARPGVLGVLQPELQPHQRGA